LAEEETKMINKMKKTALKVQYQRKEAEKRRREEMEETAKNPTSLQGRMEGLVDGDIELGVRLR
jgi:hypothetical protein